MILICVERLVLWLYSAFLSFSVVSRVNHTQVCKTYVSHISLQSICKADSKASELGSERIKKYLLPGNVLHMHTTKVLPIFFHALYAKNNMRNKVASRLTRISVPSQQEKVSGPQRIRKYADPQRYPYSGIQSKAYSVYIDIARS